MGGSATAAEAKEVALVLQRVVERYCNDHKVAFEFGKSRLFMRPTPFCSLEFLQQQIAAVHVQLCWRGYMARRRISLLRRLCGTNRSPGPALLLDCSVGKPND